jgi:hypothetical protein
MTVFGSRSRNGLSENFSKITLILGDLSSRDFTQTEGILVATVKPAGSQPTYTLFIL